MLFTAVRRAPLSPRSALRSPILSLSHPTTRKMSYGVGESLTTYLITPSELSTALRKNPPHSKISTAPRTIPLCASWFLPNDARSGYKSYLAARIPTARFFPLDDIKDPHSPYPHMLPSTTDFARAMGRLGIRRDDSVVVYDSRELGIFSAPRVGWMMQVFGHPNVHVLNNFRVWCEEGFPVESGEVREWEAVEYAVPEMDGGKVVSFDELRAIAKEHCKEGAEEAEVQILDARSLGRWKGVDPEPREGMFGSLPLSLSLSLFFLSRHSTSNRG